jgi:hypothetical protein
MSTDKNAPAPKPVPADVAVINPEARIYDLPFYTDQAAPAVKDHAGNEVVIPRRWERLQLVPGLNYQPAAKIESSGAKNHAVLRVGVDPRALAQGEAIRLATDSASAPALRRWLAVETRPPVRDAIEKRLASRRAREVAA